MEILHAYTSKDAEEDGYLFDITKVNKEWKRGIFKYITQNLLSNGYFKDDVINIPNLLDLLNQANQIVKRQSNNFTIEDNFFEGSIEAPSGKQLKIFMAMNEYGKFTIMLPEDN